jgi:hypothetical protein
MTRAPKPYQPQRGDREPETSVRVTDGNHGRKFLSPLNTGSIHFKIARHFDALIVLR